MPGLGHVRTNRCPWRKETCGVVDEMEVWIVSGGGDLGRTNQTRTRDPDAGGFPARVPVWTVNASTRTAGTGGVFSTKHSSSRNDAAPVPLWTKKLGRDHIPKDAFRLFSQHADLNRRHRTWERGLSTLPNKRASYFPVTGGRGDPDLLSGESRDRSLLPTLGTGYCLEPF